MAAQAGGGRCSPQGLGLRVLLIPAAQRAWRFMPSDCCHQTPLGDRLAGEILLAHSMENVPEVTWTPVCKPISRTQPQTTGISISPGPSPAITPAKAAFCLSVHSSDVPFDVLGFLSLAGL